MSEGQRRNYQKEMEQIISRIPEGTRPKLLLHSCCAPCSSYVLECLTPYFDIIDLYYNPNIYPEAEFIRRTEELHRLIREMHLEDRVSFLETPYTPQVFFEAVKGLEQEPEGGERCFICYEQRLRYAAQEAVKRGCDYFCTSLTISPLKNAAKLNEIGERLAEEYGAAYLPSDFKKKNGYRRSVTLSQEYDLYRQDYCGCVYSRQEREHIKKMRAASNK